MIASLFQSKKPFAICVHAVEIADEEPLDIFAIQPKPKSKDIAVRSKNHNNVWQYDLTQKDRDWFKENIKMFKLTLKNDLGRIYEPNYCDFRKEIKKCQIDLF